MQEETKKIHDGRMMQGICFQWFYDKGYGSIELYMAICRLTFGFKKRYAYLKQENFNMNPKTLKKHRDYLTSIGVLEWKKTSGYTMYRIIEPIFDISRFKLNGISVESSSIKKDKDNNIEGGW